MGRRKFEDGDGHDLPVGSFAPCQLVSISRHEPSEANLAKYKDMKPSLCFRFMLFHPPDSESHGATAVRFVTDSVSKLGKLYEFVTDLNDGTPPDGFDEDDYVGEWYKIAVRKKPGSEKLFVSTASPIDEPADVPVDWSTKEAIEETRKAAGKRKKKTAKKVEEELAAVASEDVEDEIPF